MVNTQLLENHLETSGLKQSYIIEKIGISKQAFYKKKTNKTPFRVSEIYVLCDLLRLTDSEREEIFLS